MVRVLLDVGWPWTSDKAMVSCARCGGGMFISLKYPLELYDPEDPSIPLHSYCMDMPARKAIQSQISMSVELL